MSPLYSSCATPALLDAGPEVATPITLASTQSTHSTHSPKHLRISLGHTAHSRGLGASKAQPHTHINLGFYFKQRVRYKDFSSSWENNLYSPINFSGRLDIWKVTSSKMSGACGFKKCWNLSDVYTPTGTAVSGSSLFAFYTIMPTPKALCI